MAKLNETIDVAEIAPSKFSSLPAGWYQFTVTAADVKATWASTKEAPANRIEVRCDVVGPTHQGRALFRNFNNRHPKPDVETRGRQEFAEFLRAIGLAKCDDTDLLIGKSFYGKVKCDESKDFPNEISQFKAIEGGALPAPSAAPAKAANSSAGAPPWAKK